jgi:hypothetical protein
MSLLKKNHPPRKRPLLLKRLRQKNPPRPRRLNLNLKLKLLRKHHL